MMYMTHLHSRCLLDFGQKKKNFVGTYRYRAEYSAGFEGLTHTERFYRFKRPGYPHPVCSELENNGIRVAVGDCSFTEHRRWRPPYQTSKTVHMHAKNYKHNEDGHTAPGVRSHVSVPQCHSDKNVVTKIGSQQQ